MKQLAMSLSVVVLLVAAQARAEFRYSVTPFDVPVPAGYNNITPWDINDSRQVVGDVSYYDGSDHTAAFFWQPGMPAATLLHSPDPIERGMDTRATAINNSGQTVVNHGGANNYTNVLLTDANFANPRTVMDGTLPEGWDVNNNGVVCGHGVPSYRAMYWQTPGDGGTVIGPLPGSTSVRQPDYAFSVNDFGEVIGNAYKPFTDANNNTYDKQTGFVYNIANPALMYELPPDDPSRYSAPREINNNRLVVGTCRISGAGSFYAEPVYWDNGGGAHSVRPNIPETFINGTMTDLDDNNNMYVWTDYYGNSNTWVYNPAWATAKNLEELIPADSGYSFWSIKTASSGGLVVCDGWDASGNDVQVLLSPYDVETSAVGAGSGSGADVLGGTTQTGGVSVAFDNVTGAGEIVAHYGSESTGDFALQFLSDPSDMDPIAGMVPGDTAQHWLLDFEGGSFDGSVTVTFCYDDSLLPDGFDENNLALMHYTEGAWETIVPSEINTIANTITFETDSFSPFVLAEVPEPCSAAILTMAAAGLLKRKRHSPKR